MMKRPGHTFSRSTVKRAREIQDLEMRDKTSKSLLANVLDMDDDSLTRFDGGRAENSFQPNNFVKLSHGGEDFSAKVHSATGLRHTRPEVYQIVKELRFITDQMRKDDLDTETKNDWRPAAQVVDKSRLRPPTHLLSPGT